jgi:methyl-accepting chemotaxis protein
MLNKLKIWQKLALIAVILIITNLVIVGVYVRDKNNLRRVTQDEIAGVEYLKPVFALLSGVQAHRGGAAGVLTGNESMRARLDQSITPIREAFQALEAVDRVSGAKFGTTAILAKIHSRYDPLEADVLKLTAEESRARHNAVIDDILGLARQVVDRSSLIFDPEESTHYLIDAAYVSTPRARNIFGNIRAAALPMLLSREALNANRIGMAELVARQQSALEDLTASLSRAKRLEKSNLDPVLARATDVDNEARRFLDIVRKSLLGSETVGPDFQASLVAASKTLDAFYEINKQVIEELESRLVTRSSEQRRATLLAGAAALLGIALALVIVGYVSRTVTGQVAEIARILPAVEGGNFKVRVTVLTQDELGLTAGAFNNMLGTTSTLLKTREDERDALQAGIMKLLNDISGLAEGDLTREAEVTAEATGAIADSFNLVIGELRRIIGDVHETTLQVSASANEIQTTAEHLAHGSETQSAQIVDTSAAIDEMAVSIQQVAENATVSATVADQARSTAQQGARAVDRTIAGMGAIRDQVQETAKRIKKLGESSQEIGEIVQLIGDIADRTSILALNASIQAAMAGEAGRGFAVVAEEVERLADRSTEAAQRISTLIKSVQTETNEAVAAMESTTREVVSGSGLAAEAGTTLQEIQNVSNRLAELIQSISLAAKQQARGSESLVKSMGEISQITQSTAVGTKQAAVSISNMAALADGLRESLRRFKLPDVVPALARKAARS